MMPSKTRFMPEDSYANTISGVFFYHTTAVKFTQQQISKSASHTSAVNRVWTIFDSTYLFTFVV